jgi:hypothetical protein
MENRTKDTKNINEARVSRYDRLGGLLSIAKKYEHREITISDVAREIGCSRGTVYNDFVRYFGSKGYANLQSNRTNIIRRLRELNTLELKEIISRKLKKVSANEAQKLATLVDVITEAENHDIKFIGIKSRSGFLRFFLPDGRAVNIRVAIVNNEQREHRLGLHRFRVSSAVSGYDFAIFSIRDNGTTIVYIFRSSEIAHIQSLALRYKWFERQSLYDYSRNRWVVLKDKIRL